MVPREFGARPPATLPTFGSFFRLLGRETAGRSPPRSHATPIAALPCENREGRPPPLRNSDLHLQRVLSTRSRHCEEGDDQTRKISMVHGTLEVLLIGAKGLENTDYLCTYEST
jgi:hypothetical protein